ncbi:MAG: phosphoserine phosphatase SerB [Candidatus Hydrothermarchaeales archaeon]
MLDNKVVVTVFGKDTPGLVAEITSLLSKYNINIVDIQQNVIQGLFLMFLIADLSTGTLTQGELERKLKKKSRELKLEIETTPVSEYKDYRKATPKDLYVITVLAKDRPGIVADISSILAELKVNIEKTLLTARGDLISLEFFVDLKGKDYSNVKNALDAKGSKVGLDITIQNQRRFKREKRLVVFDMDSTIVDLEIIDELAKAGGVEKEVSKITKEAMSGNLDFKVALKDRVKLLEGQSTDILEDIANNLVFTRGTEELLSTLKTMGYKTALISGGFTYFTDRVKERLNFDYAFANRLMIKDGKLTGEVAEPVIDAEAKGEIINDLARKENISTENIVAVGDGANDQIMIKNAGLGVAFNAKELLKKVSDGSLSKDNIMGLLNIIGQGE